MDLRRLAVGLGRSHSVLCALSGFLITSILLTTRDKPRYFHNFHARRALRIWPVYMLLLVVVYLNAPWFIGPSVGEAIKTAPWLAYIFFVQNLFHLTLPPAIGPTWALAIEEQYYFVWAPLVRWLRRPWMLAAVLAAALVGSPLLRHAHLHWMTPTHTLIHLDGIALGSLLALGLHTLPLSRRTWLWMGLGGLRAGHCWRRPPSPAARRIWIPRWLWVLPEWCWRSIASTGARNPINALLRCGPLAFYGRISYGLYMMHISVFIFFGSFDCAMDRGYGIAGNLAVVAMRLAVEHAGGRGALVRLRIADSQIEEAFLTRASQTRMHNRYDLRTAGSRPAAQLKGSFSMRPIYLSIITTAFSLFVAASFVAGQAAPPQAAPAAAAPTAAAPAQNPSSQATPQTVVHANTNLVLLDVVVTDRGSAVHGIDRSRFHVVEDGKEQTISSFEEHEPAPVPAQGYKPVALPPHTYSNAPVYPQASAVNVLLLDGLNTPVDKQTDVRRQMLQYMGKIAPGTCSPSSRSPRGCA